MKLRYIYTLALIAGILASCTSEEFKGGPVKAGTDTTFNLQLTTGAPITKAPYGEYEFATEEELQINHIHVALFDTEGALLLPVEELTPTGSIDMSGVEDYSVLAWTFDAIPAKKGEVRILVIANSALDYGDCTTYDDFYDKIEIESDFFSNPEMLVKVGETIVELPTAEENIIIGLTQLTARIDFIFEADLPPTTEVTPPEYELPEDIAALVGQLKNNDWNNSGAYKDVTIDGNRFKVANPFAHHDYYPNDNAPWDGSGTTVPVYRDDLVYINKISGEKITPTDKHVLIVIKGDIIKIHETITDFVYGIEMKGENGEGPKIFIDNRHLQTNILRNPMDDNSETQTVINTGEHNLMEDILSTSFGFSFYTYEKLKNGEAEFEYPLNVSFECNVTEIKTETKLYYPAHVIGIFVDKNGNPVTNLAQANTFVPIEAISVGDKPVGEPESGEPVGTSIPVRLEYPIITEGDDGFKHGYIYTMNARLVAAESKTKAESVEPITTVSQLTTVTDVIVTPWK